MLSEILISLIHKSLLDYQKDFHVVRGDDKDENCFNQSEIDEYLKRYPDLYSSDDSTLHAYFCGGDANFVKIFDLRLIDKESITFKYAFYSDCEPLEETKIIECIIGLSVSGDINLP